MILKKDDHLSITMADNVLVGNKTLGELFSQITNNPLCILLSVVEVERFELKPEVI